MDFPNFKRLIYVSEACNTSFLYTTTNVQRCSELETKIIVIAALYILSWNNTILTVHIYIYIFITLIHIFFNLIIVASNFNRSEFKYTYKAIHSQIAREPRNQPWMVTKSKLLRITVKCFDSKQYKANTFHVKMASVTATQSSYS